MQSILRLTRHAALVLAVALYAVVARRARRKVRSCVRRAFGGVILVHVGGALQVACRVCGQPPSRSPERVEATITGEIHIKHIHRSYTCIYISWV